MVKTAFLDEQLKKQFILSSANSINIARLLPQSFYYFNALALCRPQNDSILFSVPCGNFGNLTAGIIAKKLGLPIEKFIAAVNENDVFPIYLNTGDYKPKTAKETLSNAMDVGDPSNFDRILDLYKNDRREIQKLIESYSISDHLIREGIREIYDMYGYLIDPHGAVGYQALKNTTYNSTKRYQTIILETAHPAKFIDIVTSVINKQIEMPDRLQSCLNKQKNAILVSDDYQDFKSALIKWIR
jgi:threonine synthase